MIKEKIKLGTSGGWVTLVTLDDFKSAGSPIGNVVRIEVTKNHKSGCDCKVAAIQVVGGFQVLSEEREADSSESLDLHIDRYMQYYGSFLLIYICNFHVLSHFLLIYIYKLHWL
jgi:Anaphase-promoting complex, subunit 10 (APC10)